MPVWIKLSDGSYFLVIESTKYSNQKNPFIIQMLYSQDGISWSTPKDLYRPKADGSKAAAPGVVQLSTGQLVVSFQTDEDLSTKGDSVSIVKTIYSDGTSPSKLTKDNFTAPEQVFNSGSGETWSAIYHKNGWIYVVAGGTAKKIYVGPSNN